MTIRIIIAAIFFTYSSISFADEVDKLKDLLGTSEDLKTLTIECLIEIKSNRSKGWESAECTKFKQFSDSKMQTYKAEVKTAILAFKSYSTSGEASKRKLKRGLKQLILIQENMRSISHLANKIKNESKT